MRTSSRTSDSPDPGGYDSVDRTRRTDGIDGLNAAGSSTPPAMAGNTLMDGAASQLGGAQSQPNYDLAGPDDGEEEEE